MNERFLGMVEALRRAKTHAQLVHDCLDSPVGPGGRFLVPEAFRHGELLEGGVVQSNEPGCNLTEIGCRGDFKTPDLSCEEVAIIQQKLVGIIDWMLFVVNGSAHNPRH